MTRSDAHKEWLSLLGRIERAKLISDDEFVDLMAEIECDAEMAGRCKEEELERARSEEILKGLKEEDDNG